MVNRVLENGHHSREDILECLDWCFVFFWIETHGQLTECEKSVSPNLGTLGIANGFVEQPEEIQEILFESFSESL
jgi:hypothetical protein